MGLRRKPLEKFLGNTLMQVSTTGIGDRPPLSLPVSLCPVKIPPRHLLGQGEKNTHLQSECSLGGYMGYNGIGLYTYMGRCMWSVGATSHLVRPVVHTWGDYKEVRVEGNKMGNCIHRRWYSRGTTRG